MKKQGKTFKNQIRHCDSQRKHQCPCIFFLIFEKFVIKLMIFYFTYSYTVKMMKSIYLQKFTVYIYIYINSDYTLQ